MQANGPATTATLVILAACLWTATASAAAPAPAAEPSGPRQVLLLEPSKGNPRNSEGDFLVLRDGRTVLFVYTHFTGGEADEATAHLALRRSRDGGLTWSDKDEDVPTLKGRFNVMSVTLRRLKDGRVALFYLVKNSWSDCRLYMHASSDDGATWGPAVLCTTDEGYFVVNNDRVVELRSGRLVVPAALHKGADGRFVSRGRARCYLSDDAGRTWRAGRTTLEGPPGSRSGLQEPLVVELKDGRLMMLCRTDQGSQFRSYSADGGDTWSPAEPTDIASPLSPATVERLPDGELLMVFNDHRGIDRKLLGRRTPLTLALSRDEGKTWTKLADLETDPEGWFCYTAMQVVGDRVLLAYGAGRRRGDLGRTKLVAFDLPWLRGLSPR